MDNSPSSIFVLGLFFLFEETYNLNKRRRNYENNEKVLAAGLTAVMAMSLMVGCGSKKDDSSSKTYNLGIIQFAEHGSLDNCRKGFLKGLESGRYQRRRKLKDYIQKLTGRYSHR